MIIKKQKPHLINSIEIEAQPPTNYTHSVRVGGRTNGVMVVVITALIDRGKLRVSESAESGILLEKSVGG